MGALSYLVKLDAGSVFRILMRKRHFAGQEFSEISVALGLSPPRLDHSPDAGDNDNRHKNNHPEDHCQRWMHKTQRHTDQECNRTQIPVISYPPAAT